MSKNIIRTATVGALAVLMTGCQLFGNVNLGDRDNHTTHRAGFQQTIAVNIADVTAAAPGQAPLIIVSSNSRVVAPVPLHGPGSSNQFSDKDGWHALFAVVTPPSGILQTATISAYFRSSGPAAVLGPPVWTVTIVTP